MLTRKRLKVGQPHEEAEGGHIGWVHSYGESTKDKTEVGREPAAVLGVPWCTLVTHTVISC